MLYLAADHNGFWLKEELKSYLKNHAIAFKDMGASRYSKGDDYPEFAAAAARKIGSRDLGIFICGSGHGMSIVANKFKGVRAAHCSSVFSAEKSREDDHANVLVLSSWETSIEKAKRIVKAWLSAKPSKAMRHVRRIKKISRLDK